MEKHVERRTITADAEYLRSIVREAVQEGFTAVGIESDDPRAMQADMQYLREARLGTNNIRRTVKTTLVGTLVTGLASIIWWAFDKYVRG